MWVGPARRPYGHPLHPELGLLVMAAIACAGTLLRVDFEFRKETSILTFTGVAYVLGLAFCTPTVMVAGSAIGTTIAYVVWRLPVVKICFNLVTTTLDIGVIRVVFTHLTGRGPILAPHNWPAVIGALLIDMVVNNAAVLIVIRLSSGQFSGRRAVTPMLINLAMGASNAILGLLSAVVIAAQPEAAILLVFGAVAAAVGYRGYTRQSARYANLRLLYDFSGELADARSGEEVASIILERSAATLNAERAVLVLPGGGVLVRTTLGPNGHPVSVRAEGPDVFETLVLTSGQPVLAGRRSRQFRKDLAAAGYKDLIAAPLALEDTTGVLVLADRAANGSTFDKEDLRLLGALANHASIAFRNGQLVDQLTAEAANRAHQALHDALTGLGNRLLFTERLQAALDTSGDLIVAVMLMDLDEFKEINDTLGHATGDSVLREVADRLSRTVGNHGTVARLGGDEFAVAVPNCPTIDHAMRLARTVHHQFNTPIEVEGMTLEVRASIGVTVAPKHGTDPNLLLQRADVAMYSAKQARRGVELYAAERDHYSPRRLSLAADLRHDLDAGKLWVAFQPKVEVATKRVAGFEALVRWNHPTYGPIPPDEFVPIAEQSGLIAGLTRWVLQAALEQIAKLRQQGMDLTIAVNLSARSLLDANLVDDISRALQRADVSPTALTLELTETTVMSDPRRSAEVLAQLSALGCHLAIDDFGTGYSSLTRLRQLPVNEIKIDKSFVLHMATDTDDAAIVRSIIDLARNLGLVAVAEGVEDAETCETLAQLGCEQIQGYFFSKPKPGSELQAWLEGQIVTRRPVLLKKRPMAASA